MNGVCVLDKEGNIRYCKGFKYQNEHICVLFCFHKRRGSITQVRGVRSTHVIVTEEYRFVNYRTNILYQKL